MLLAASSNRSKNWRSLDTTSCDRRGMTASPSGGFLSGSKRAESTSAPGRLPGVELGRLDAARDHLDELALEALAERRRARRCVVGGAAVLDRPVVVQEGVGGAGVAVERYADAARVDELDAVRTLAPERQVRMTEDEHPLSRVADQLGLLRGGLGEEALDVGDRGAVAVADARGHQLLRQRAQLLHEILAERVPAGRDCALRQRVVGSILRVGGPAVDVASYPLRPLKPAEPLDGLARPRTEHRVVAAEDVARSPRRAGVLERGLERREVAVHVVEQRDGHGGALTRVARPGPAACAASATRCRPPPRGRRGWRARSARRGSG